MSQEREPSPGPARAGACIPVGSGARDVHAGAPFLATDVGGTSARIALVRRTRDGGVEVLEHETYACAGFDSLPAIVAAFLAAPGRGRVQDAVIGCAGVRHGDRVTGANLPWPVTLSDLHALGLERVDAVNDFVAVAHAVPCLPQGHHTLLAGPESGATGPALVVGPGTGLGVAYRIPYAGGTVVLPSEAGQMAFAPGSSREAAVQARLAETRPHVAAESVVSGPGLLNAYRALAGIDGVAPSAPTPAEVVAAAHAGEPLAREAVHMFCEAFGSLAGDLVLAGSATSVYVAGGIVPKIRGELAASRFHARFVNKGAMRSALEQVPVWVMDHPHQGVIGAAHWYLSRVPG